MHIFLFVLASHQTGETLGLTVEFLSAIGQANDMEIGKFMSVSNNENAEQEFGLIRATPQHPFMSSIAKVNPSPDWFTGFRNFDLRANNGEWHQSFTISSFPWTAGAMIGDDYTSGGVIETDPSQPITQFTIETVPETDIFLNNEKTEVLPVAQWSCEFQDIIAENREDNQMNQSGIVILETVAPTEDSTFDSTVGSTLVGTMEMSFTLAPTSESS